MRELADMAVACQSERWNHTAALEATLANIHRDPKKGRMLQPVDFHPLLKTRIARSGPPLKGDIQMLKTLFVDRRPQ
jgi:hypothetical protein